ncbi:MAG: beta-lactamase family protein [Gammaproteobacteria bacterium]|nr:beta-lactamase family protein [Gammaproteobacteria bacterium]MBU2057240.1 beta-lactamase family protein [Gammaproteobacteria bacterium]MBU2174842.1 beta-lactamase family protein [Gammaproteobacteria bacterium]MBU2245447.1 beta-lactamase family protein [Gammaproteobacteria bacterium]MBU2344228.1 beta-lactamase family protein [Gammaproteobacteria bacterium]
MQLLYRWTVFSLLLAVSGCSGTPDCTTDTAPLSQTNNKAVTALADELQREHKAGTFAGQVLIAQNNSVVFKTAYGCADRQHRVKNSITTVSDMGSIAKTFTAAAVLQLVANQKLQLSTKVGDLYPEAADAIKPVTIEQLLGHSGGLDNFHNDSDFELMDKTEAERRILSMPLIAAPGEKIAYSNAAYTLLAAIVEKTTHQSFQEYVRQHLLNPLKLADTGFYQDSTIPVSKLARGYGGDDEGKTTYQKGLTWALIGAGGMLTSVDDLASWFAALKDGSLFPDNTANLTFTQANEKWLLGSFSTLDIQGEPIIQMGGSTDFGYTALIQFVPDRDLLVVLLLNAHNTKYANATHHRLSRNHILPIVQGEDSPDKLSDN